MVSHPTGTNVHSGVEISAGESSALMVEIDTNGDGKIDFSEFAAIAEMQVTHPTTRPFSTLCALLTQQTEASFCLWLSTR